MPAKKPGSPMCIKERATCTKKTDTPATTGIYLSTVTMTSTGTTNTMATLKGKMITDTDEEEHYVVCFAFKYVSADGVRIEFSIDPTTTEPSEWLALVDAIKTNKTYSVNTCPSNGDVMVGHENGKIEMQAHKAGAGGDGDLQVFLPAGACLAAIEKCAVAYAAHDCSLPASSP